MALFTNYNKDVRLPVTEAYFGKSKELLKAEKALNDLCALLYKDFNGPFDISGFTKMVEKLVAEDKAKKAIRDFENCMIKQFGFGEFKLGFFHIPWVQNRRFQKPQAMTMANGIIRHIRADMVHITPLMQKDGGYYDKTHSYSCCVLITYEFFNLKPNGGELMAIILHEIGHNFQCTPMTNIGYFLPYLQLHKTLLNAIAKGDLSQDEYISSLLAGIVSLQFLADALNIVSRIYDRLVELLHDTMPTVFNLTNRITKLIQVIAMAYPTINFTRWLDTADSLVFGFKHVDPVELVNSLCGYSGEVFADSFAATYGYGPELNSALGKADYELRIQYAILMNPKFNPLYFIWEFAFVYLDIARSIFSLDAHPATQRRLFNTLEKLEKDINSGQLPPKMKKQALKDLAEARSIYKDFLEAKTEDKKLTILAQWRIISDTMNNHNLDIRSVLNKVLNFGNHYA